MRYLSPILFSGLLILLAGAVLADEAVEEEQGAASEEIQNQQGPKKGRGHRGERRFHPPKPEELFRQFDKDGDKKLDQDEFHALMKSMRAMHERHRLRGERGSRQGPPPEGSGNRQGRGDHPRPPREGRSDYQGKEDRNVQRNVQGPDRPRRPDPGQVFERFDQDENNQLSREEFFELGKAMRARHERGGRGGRRGSHQGPPGEGQRGFRRPGPPDNGQ